MTAGSIYKHFKEKYSHELKVGSLWARDDNLASLCRITMVAGSLRVEAEWLETEDRPSRVFRAATGIFLSDFHPADQIVAKRSAAIETDKAVSKVRLETVLAAKSIIEARTNGLVNALADEQSIDLVKRVREILLTTIDQQLIGPLAVSAPPDQAFPAD
jgi:hypothetical protein